MENFGFVEYSFLANNILVGIWGNKSMQEGQVLPEMARRPEKESGLLGTYIGSWMYLDNQRVDFTLTISPLDTTVSDPVPVGAGLNLLWDAGDGGTFHGRATLVAPDRLVGYYWWG
jgi:hypothetical protein